MDKPKIQEHKELLDFFFSVYRVLVTFILPRAETVAETKKRLTKNGEVH